MIYITFQFDLYNISMWNFDKIPRGRKKGHFGGSLNVVNISDIGYVIELH